MEIVADLTIIFVAAATMLIIMDRFNHPSLPGYIIAGIISGTLISSQDLLNLAQIGIAFLIFIFGLKYNPISLKSTAKTAINTSLLQMLITGGLAYLLASLIGFDSNNSFYFAAAAALSSSLVGLQLTEREIHTNLLHGRLSESIHFVQDMVAFALIAVILSATTNSAVTALIVTGLMIGGAILFRDHVFEVIAEQADGNQELITMAALSMLIGFIGLSQALGISMVVGAFAAGVAASKFPYNIELLDTMGSIKDFFSAIFFVILGALLTIPSQTVLASAIGLIMVTSIVGPLTVYFSLKAFGYDSRTSLLTSLSIDQISELALVIAIQGFLLNLISQATFEAIILAAITTMIISSYTKKHEEEIYRTIGRQRGERKRFDPKDHVILVGYDIQGKKIVETLLDEETELIVIDNDPEKISDLEKQEIKAVYGDVIDNITWEEANYKDAKLIISTVPSITVSEHILGLETGEKIVRAETPIEALKLLEKGALHTLVPDLAAGEKLREHIEGLENNPRRKERLRRKSLLEFRKYLNS